MEEVDKEISEMKLSLNARARIVAESYLSTVSPRGVDCAACFLACLTDTNRSPLYARTNASLPDWIVTRFNIYNL